MWMALLHYTHTIIVVNVNQNIDYTDPHPVYMVHGTVSTCAKVTFSQVTTWALGQPGWTSKG